LGAGVQLGVTFNQAVAVAQGFSVNLTDGTNLGTIDGASASVALSPDDTVVTLTLLRAPSMIVGQSLSGTNLEVLAESGISDSYGAWNLVMSGAISMATDASPRTCSPVNARVFGGTNCLNFGSPSFRGPNPSGILDVIPTPTPDLPGPIRTGRTGQPVDQAPEVITNCGYGSTDVVFDLATAGVLGTQPCGTVWDEADIGNTTSPTLDYIPTPAIKDFQQIGVVETIPGSLWVSGTALGPQIVSAVRQSSNSVTFTFNTPVTCPDPGTLSASDAAAEATQFVWYAQGQAGYTVNYASSITCPSQAGGLTITATWGKPSTGAPPPIGTVFFKFDQYGASPTSGKLLVPIGGTASPLAGERVLSESFRAAL
jgi:hypothetical protein